MRYKGVIFDLGNTLVAYYSRPQWPAVLDQCIDAACGLLAAAGQAVDRARLPSRIAACRGERPDGQVVPLIDRLRSIFEFGSRGVLPAMELELCRRFMQPIFATARLYDDVLPSLRDLRRLGLKTAILSNTPWGSSPELWREELARHGLLDAVNVVAFCGDVGYRKPAPQPFLHVLGKLGLGVHDCVFVGDDPRWDIAGPKAIGMDAVLICRQGDALDAAVPVIRDLRELQPLL